MKKEQKQEVQVEEKSAGYVWWLTIVIIVLLIAFFGFGYALGASNIAKETKDNINEITGPGEKSVKVTDEVKTKLARFIKAGSEWRSTGVTRDYFLNGTTELTKDVKLKMTTATMLYEKKTTRDVTLTSEEIDKITGAKPDAGEKVDTITVTDYNKIYKELFNEEPNYEFSELGSTGCPAPVSINNDTGVMYLLHRCGGATAATYEDTITSYDADENNYYVHQELKETPAEGSTTTTKLVWKFDKDLKFVSTTKE